MILKVAADANKTSLHRAIIHQYHESKWTDTQKNGLICENKWTAVAIHGLRGRRRCSSTRRRTLITRLCTEHLLIRNTKVNGLRINGLVCENRWTAVAIHGLRVRRMCSSTRRRTLLTRLCTEHLFISTTRVIGLIRPYVD